jgi:hypothetical protein
MGMSLVYGIDWSGAARAGDKIWVATIDREENAVLDVGRPWKARTNPDVTYAVADWLGCLGSGWIGLDSPLGLASTDRMSLIGTTSRDPFQWSREILQRYPTREGLIGAAIEAKLIGRHRRATDARLRSPFPPLLFQLIHQTYAAFRLISRLERSRVRILPWQHALARPVTLLEACPAITLRSLGLSNRNYKLKADSRAVRERLLYAALHHQGWTIREDVRDAVLQDPEGDGLDAILCAIAASNAIDLDHAKIAAEPAALEEGWIYS